jgi:hypothetical protein
MCDRHATTGGTSSAIHSASDTPANSIRRSRGNSLTVTVLGITSLAPTSLDEYLRRSNGISKSLKLNLLHPVQS